MDSVGGMKNADPQLQRFIEGESQKQRFQHLVHELTGQCWEQCMDKPSNRIDGKTHKCLVNCVERFIDTTNFVVNKLQQSAPPTLHEPSL